MIKMSSPNRYIPVECKQAVEKGNSFVLIHLMDGYN